MVFYSHPCQIAQDKIHSHLDLPGRLMLCAAWEKADQQSLHLFDMGLGCQLLASNFTKEPRKGMILGDDSIPGWGGVGWELGRKKNNVWAKTSYTSFCPGKFIWGIYLYIYMFICIYMHFYFHEMIHPCLVTIKAYLSTCRAIRIAKCLGIWNL